MSQSLANPSLCGYFLKTRHFFYCESRCDEYHYNNTHLFCQTLIYLYQPLLFAVRAVFNTAFLLFTTRRRLYTRSLELQWLAVARLLWSIARRVPEPEVDVFYRDSQIHRCSTILSNFLPLAVIASMTYFCMMMTCCARRWSTLRCLRKEKLLSTASPMPIRRGSRLCPASGLESSRRGSPQEALRAMCWRRTG